MWKWNWGFRESSSSYSILWLVCKYFHTSQPARQAGRQGNTIQFNVLTLWALPNQSSFPFLFFRCRVCLSLSWHSLPLPFRFRLRLRLQFSAYFYAILIVIVFVFLCLFLTKPIIINKWVKQNYLFVPYIFPFFFLFWSTISPWFIQLKLFCTPFPLSQAPKQLIIWLLIYLKISLIL